MAYLKYFWLCFFVLFGCNGANFYGKSKSKESNSKEASTEPSPENSEEAKDLAELSCDELTTRFNQLYASVDPEMQSCSKDNDCSIVYNFPETGGTPGCLPGQTKTVNTEKGKPLLEAYAAFFTKCRVNHKTSGCSVVARKCTNSICSLVWE
jgi:hypothetical protein